MPNPIPTAGQTSPGYRYLCNGVGLDGGIHAMFGMYNGTEATGRTYQAVHGTGTVASYRVGEMNDDGSMIVWTIQNNSDPNPTRFSCE